VFTEVVQHVDECFHDFYRSRKHYIPDPEDDIKLFMARHAELKVHEHIQNRLESKIEKHAHNCFEAGRVNIMAKKYLEELGVKREQYFGFITNVEQAKSKGTPIEEILAQMRLEHEQSHNHNSNINRIVQALIGDQQEGTENKVEDLLFEGDEPEADKEGQPRRHVIG
jgi:hypothetical protein